VRDQRLCLLHDPKAVAFCPDEPRPEKKDEG